MPLWDYQVTLHELPEPRCEEGNIIECDQVGQCFIHDTCRGGIEWLEDLLSQKGMEGWELVQSGYHNRQLLCIWKRKIESKREG